MAKSQVKPKPNRQKRKPYAARQLPGTISTLTEAWRYYRAHSGLIILTGVVATAVNSILDILVTAGTPIIVKQLWVSIMLSVFVWVTVQITVGKRVTLGKAFYEGSASFLKQFLILTVWVVYLLPFLAWAMVVPLLSPQAGASEAESFTAGVVWLVLGMVSGFWLIRSIFAPFIALKAKPLQAVKDSWKLSKNTVSRLAPRLFAGLIIALLPLFLVFGLNFTLLPEITAVQAVLNVAYGLIVFTFSFPFMVVYVYKLRPNEQSARPRPKTKK